MEKNTSNFKYLEKLEFDPRQFTSIVYRLIVQFRSVILLILLIIGLGIYNFITLPRELSPEIDIPIAQVTIVVPGGSPGDIEQLVIKPIEDVVSPIEEIDYTRSIALQSSGNIIVYFNDGTDLTKAIEKIRTEIESIELPQQAKTPIVQAFDFNEIPILQTSLVGKVDLLSLSKIAAGLRTRLEDSQYISKAELSGNLEDKIYISLKLDSIQKYEITPSQLIDTIKNNNTNLPSGSYDIDGIKYQIDVNNSINSIDDVRNIILNLNGQSIPLTQVAEVSYKPDIENTNKIIYEPKGGEIFNAVQLRVLKSNNTSTDEATAAADRIIDSYLQAHTNISRVDITNEAQNVQDQLGDLTNNFITAVILVFIILFLFLGIKQATVVFLSMLLSFLTTFIFMGASGITINFVSLLSFLLALGLIVDNSIVILSNYSLYHRSNKFNTVETALMVYKDYKIPILTITLTTIWAFLPLLLSTGIIGEYIRPIPIVVSVALLASALIALFINLPLMINLNTSVPGHVRKTAKIVFYILIFIIIYGLIALIFPYSITLFSSSVGKVMALFILIFSITATYFAIKYIKFPQKALIYSKQMNLLNRRFLNLRKITNIYENLIRKILFDRRYKIIILAATGIFMLISIFFVAGGFLKYEFFPKSDSELVYVNITGPAGWTAGKLQPHIEKSMEAIRELNELKFMTVIEGTNIKADQSLSTGENLAYIIVKLVKQKDRKLDSMQITQELRSTIKAEVEIPTSVLQFSGGPPLGADIQINILGEDYIELEKLGNKVNEILSAQSEIVDIQTSLQQASGQIRIILSNDELAKRQLSAQEVSLWLRSIVSGSEIGEITNTSGEDQNIIVDVKKNYNLSELENILIPSAEGTKYTLSEIAEIRLDTLPSVIEHKNNKRMISITAYVNERESATVIFQKKIVPALARLELPEGYTWETGGINEQNQKSVNSIISQMLLAFVLIFTTMVLQTNSFRKTLLVLSIIPIAISAVFFNFTIFRIPLSFSALIGILALFGITVNNTIMLIDKVTQNHKIGFEYIEGIINACTSRLEPIFFKIAIIIAGLLPLTLSNPLWQGLGGAIISGLCVSGIIIVFFFPIACTYIFKKT